MLDFPLPLRSNQYIVFVGARYKHVRCINSKLRVLYSRDPPAKWTAVIRSAEARSPLNTKFRYMKMFKGICCLFTRRVIPSIFSTINQYTYVIWVVDCPLHISTHSSCVSASTESHSHFWSSPAYTFSQLVRICSHYHHRLCPLCVSAHRKCISPFDRDPPAGHCTLALGDSNCIEGMSTDKLDSSYPFW